MDVLTKLYCTAFKDAAKQIKRYHYHLSMCFKNALALTTYAINEENALCSAYHCIACEYKNLLPYMVDPILCPSRGETLDCNPENVNITRTTVTAANCAIPIIIRIR